MDVYVRGWMWYGKREEGEEPISEIPGNEIDLLEYGEVFVVTERDFAHHLIQLDLEARNPVVFQFAVPGHDELTAHVLLPQISYDDPEMTDYRLDVICHQFADQIAVALS